MDIMVGELIDLLQPYRGRGDRVIIEDGDGWVYRVLGVRWDNVVKVVVIDIEELEYAN